MNRENTNQRHGLSRVREQAMCAPDKGKLHVEQLGPAVWAAAWPSWHFVSAEVPEGVLHCCKHRWPRIAASSE